MAHAEHVLLQLDDGSSAAVPQLTRRQDALVKVHDDLRACEAELIATRRQLKAAQSALAAVRVELAEARQRKLSPEQRAEIEAQGMACRLDPADTAFLGVPAYRVASGSEPGKVHLVTVTGDNWRAWGCNCQGGAHGCRHKRRARQEQEMEAKRAERAERAADKPAVPRVRLTVGGRAVE